MSGQLTRLTTALSDRYAIERELGAGGMATVYLAEDLKHKRKVAIKVLKPELAAVLGADRFVQEITTTAALQHPHILPLFDSGESDGFLWYAMPFIDGETLRGKLDRETQLGIEESVRIASDVASALQYAHTHGVIHRDIKPENILLHDGRPMVADFGIALALSAAAGGRMTETGMSLGTPHYMSPEQATAEKEITARSDVYSLGSVLYEMLTGEPPHMGNSAQQIIMKIITEDAAPVTKLRKAVPGNVAAAVGKSLEKLPADRFESAKAFAEALGNPGFTAASQRAGEVGVSRGSWLRDWRSLGTLVVATAAVLGLGWLSTRPAGSSGPTAYDVGLPDSAAMSAARSVGYAVAPSGTFVVYQTGAASGRRLWYRSLQDATARSIEGTDGATMSAISPDEDRVAFVRSGSQGYSLDIISLDGGKVTTLARGSGIPDQLEWLADGRVLLIENDGKQGRWFDPGGGATTTRGLSYCIMAFPLADPEQMLCGGGGDMQAMRIQLSDSVGSTPLWTGTDSGAVNGSHFRVVDDRYLTYISMGGDLLAAPVDLATGRVGKSVRLETGLGRRNYTGAGTYAISATGTLVYAQGANEAVGSLVRAGPEGLDTLPVGTAPFLRWNISPDGTQLAVVVESLEGEQLRIYDLDRGRHVVMAEYQRIRQPVWSPDGARVWFTAMDTAFIGVPGMATRPEMVTTHQNSFEAFSWLPDGRLIGTEWVKYRASVVQVDRRPATIDSLRPDVTFIHASPDARWIAYSNRAFTDLWLEPFPRDGRRFLVATGGVGEPQWVSSTRLAASAFGATGARVDFFDVTASADPPVGPVVSSILLPGFMDTAGQSFTVTPDGHVVYVQGRVERGVPYLRVIPNWTTLMKQRVDEANR